MNGFKRKYNVNTHFGSTQTSIRVKYIHMAKMENKHNKLKT